MGVHERPHIYFLSFSPFVSQAVSLTTGCVGAPLAALVSSLITRLLDSPKQLINGKLLMTERGVGFFFFQEIIH